MKLRYLALALAFSLPALAQSSPTSTDALPDDPGTTTTVKPPVVPTGPTVVIDTTM